MSTHTPTTEELYLKFFKFVILTVMSLTLLCAAGALIFAAYQYGQSPKAPAPAQKAPPKSVNVEDFLKQLKPGAPKQEAPVETEVEPAEPAPVPAASAATKYKEEAKKIVGCDVESMKQAKASNGEASDDKVEGFRKELQRIADFKGTDRGQPFVTDLAKVSCAIYLHSQVVEYRKAHHDSDIFAEAINFHIKAWDGLKEEAARFEQDEEDRVKQETQQEEMRVAMAKETAKFSLMVAAGAFALFMALALYLIISAIESNLRQINRSIEKLAAEKPQALETSPQA